MINLMFQLAHDLGYGPMLIMGFVFVFCAALAVVHGTHRRQRGLCARQSRITVGLFGAGMALMGALLLMTTIAEHKGFGAQLQDRIMLQQQVSDTQHNGGLVRSMPIHAPVFQTRTMEPMGPTATQAQP